MAQGGVIGIAFSMVSGIEFIAREVSANAGLPKKFQIVMVFSMVGGIEFIAREVSANTGLPKKFQIDDHCNL